MSSLSAIAVSRVESILTFFRSALFRRRVTAPSVTVSRLEDRHIAFGCSIALPLATIKEQQPQKTQNSTKSIT
jgi:hypothetical protein